MLPMSNLNRDDNPYLFDPDVQLMLAFQKGHRASFEILLVKFYPRVLNFIYRYIGNRHTAEELTQEVFLKVYNHCAHYRPESRFQTWVYTIAKNVSLNELRRNKQTILSLDEPVRGEDGTMQRQIADSQAVGADEELMTQETVLMIKKAIDVLPENQRMAVILRRYENFSYEEIARTMDLSMEAVKSLLSRAKENLKVSLAHVVKGK